MKRITDGKFCLKNLEANLKQMIEFDELEIGFLLNQIELKAMKGWLRHENPKSQNQCNVEILPNQGPRRDFQVLDF